MYWLHDDNEIHCSFYHHQLIIWIFTRKLIAKKQIKTVFVTHGFIHSIESQTETFWALKGFESTEKSVKISDW